MSIRALKDPCEDSDHPSIRALMIDLDTHQHLLAVLLDAVDRLPGGARAIAGAIATLDRYDALGAAMAQDPDPSAPMARAFVTARLADRINGAAYAAPRHSRPITSREDAARVE